MSAVIVMVLPGLCATCANANQVQSSKGSTFIRCELSFADPRFARYPTLPVTSCPGYEPSSQTEPGARA